MEIYLEGFDHFEDIERCHLSKLNVIKKFRLPFRWFHSKKKRLEIGQTLQMMSSITGATMKLK
jgi:hypothetical protein